MPSEQPTTSSNQPSAAPPGIRWNVVVQVAIGVVVLWVVALMVQPYWGWWPAAVLGVLTLVAAGFGVYAWRLARRSKALVSLLQGATDAEGRKRALEQLEQAGDKDALNALARAQLVAQEKPAEAIAILEAVDIKKAPMLVQGDIRANLALLYLAQHRVRDARPLVDELRLDRQPNPQAKALYAAVTAECFARTGRAAEARSILETFSTDDPDYAEAAPLLLRAQVFTYFATTNRGLARNAMLKLITLNPNFIASFLQKGVPPEIQRAAREVLDATGARPKQKVRMRA